MTDRSAIPAGELSDAAFALLTASSVDRYIRMAKEAAALSSVRHVLAREPDRIPEVLIRGRESWRAVLQTVERDLGEWELAIILPILAQTATPEMNGLLRTVALSEQRNATWLAALARRLLQERAENQIEAAIWVGHAEARGIRVENGADSRRERVVKADGFYAHASEDTSSQRILLAAA